MEPANSRIHEPSVNDSATIAAVALDSVMAAARKATPAITNAYRAWPRSTVSSSGTERWPPSSSAQIASAESVGASAMHQPTASAASFKPTSRFMPIGSCKAIFSAPVCFSLPMARMATNGNRNVFIR